VRRKHQLDYVAGFVSIEEQFKEMAMKTIAEFNADLTQ
jgi:hypothetical protein